MNRCLAFAGNDIVLDTSTGHFRSDHITVDSLDLGTLGFGGVDPKATGRPSYHPSVLLKLYVYGYLNAVQSSRRLEREAGRNVEVMWLTGRLVPDHKTIAEFRKNNGPAIRRVCAQFVELCRRLGLLAQASVAVDGRGGRHTEHLGLLLAEMQVLARAEPDAQW